MILAELGPLTAYRMHAPRWATAPTSGAGAAAHGGRANRPGVSALYLALEHETMRSRKPTISKVLHLRRSVVPSKTSPLSRGELAAFEAKRDLAAELVQAIREMKAGKTHVVLSTATEARERTGLSQSQFAALLGVSVRTLQGWEEGRKQPSGAARTLLIITIAHTNPKALLAVASKQHAGSASQARALDRLGLLQQRGRGLLRQPPGGCTACMCSPTSARPRFSMPIQRSSRSAMAGDTEARHPRRRRLQPTNPMP